MLDLFKIFTFLCTEYNYKFQKGRDLLSVLEYDFLHVKCSTYLFYSMLKNFDNLVHL